jgi:hypothetical protein
MKPAVGAVRGLRRCSRSCQPCEGGAGGVTPSRANDGNTDWTADERGDRSSKITQERQAPQTLASLVHREAACVDVPELRPVKSLQRIA